MSLFLESILYSGGHLGQAVMGVGGARGEDRWKALLAQHGVGNARKCEAVWRRIEGIATALVQVTVTGGHVRPSGGLLLRRSARVVRLRIVGDTSREAKTSEDTVMEVPVAGDGSVSGDARGVARDVDFTALEEGVRIQVALHQEGREGPLSSEFVIVNNERRWDRRSDLVTHIWSREGVTESLRLSPHRGGAAEDTVELRVSVDRNWEPQAPES